MKHTKDRKTGVEDVGTVLLPVDNTEDNEFNPSEPISGKTWYFVGLVPSLVSNISVQGEWEVLTSGNFQ